MEYRDNDFPEPTVAPPKVRSGADGYTYTFEQVKNIISDRAKFSALEINGKQVPEKDEELEILKLKTNAELAAKLPTKELNDIIKGLLPADKKAAEKFDDDKVLTQSEAKQLLEMQKRAQQNKSQNHK